MLGRLHVSTASVGSEISMNDVKDRVVFITGGVSGIGFGIAKAFVSAGCKTIVTYMQRDHAEKAMAAFGSDVCNVHALQLDVTDRQAVARAADEADRIFGKVHILCNNAGVNAFGRLDEATFEDWDWILGVNLVGVINCLVTFLPRIKKHKEGGHIINVGSVSAFVSDEFTGVYAASKAAVHVISQSLRDSLKPHNIGVSFLCPGLVKTNIFASLRNRPSKLANTAFHNDEEFLTKLTELHSLGIDPLLVGEKTLRSVLRNDFYVFSHLGCRHRINKVYSEVMAAIEDVHSDKTELNVQRMRKRKLNEISKLLMRTNTSKPC
jgi:NAD(P)-dependent dehydrogenase (short-subunit alcohol dehydrogenase family)